MSRTFKCARVFAVVAACVIVPLGSPATMQASMATRVSSARALTCGDVADQLGIKITSERDRELTLGLSLSGTLADPAKLARFGIRGMHEGARVTVVRTSPVKLLVEADELEPVAITKRTHLKVDESGILAPIIS